MIYFITNDPERHQILTDNEIKIVNSENGLLDLQNEIEDCAEAVNIDTETTGLDPYVNTTLLIGFHIKNTFIIDVTPSEEGIINVTPVFKLIQDLERTVIGHNFKFDYKMLRINHNVDFIPEKIYDTMIASQILTQGSGAYQRMFIPKGMPGFYSLYETIKRTLNYIPMDMDKSITSEFVGMNPATCVFHKKHITYLAADVKYLPKVFSIQLENLAENGLLTIAKTECANIPIYAMRELVPVKLDVAAWKQLIRGNEKIEYEESLALDLWVKTHRTDLTKELSLLITGGQYDRPRNFQPKLTSTNMFGETVEIEQSKHEANTNWNSSSEIIWVFAVVGAELPTEKGYRVPELAETFKYYVQKGATQSGKIEWKAVDKINYERYKSAGYLIKAESQGLTVSNNDSYDPFTTGMDKIEQMLIEKPEHVMADFIHHLKVLKEASADINNRGNNFINIINPVTKGIHTSYRQRDALNGRVQSGNMDEGYFNSQNMKNFESNDETTDNKYKKCFSLPNFHWCSTDWTGAEMIILCALSADMRLYDMFTKDMHSVIATMYWREVFKQRSVQYLSKNLAKYQHYKNLSETFEVTKKLNKALRQHKISFPIFYGARPKKILQVIQNIIPETKDVHLEDAEIIFKWFNGYFAKAMKFLDNVVNQVRWYGQLRVPIFNTLIHFPEVEEKIEDAKRFQEEYNPKDHWFKITKPEDARNLIISSFQREALGLAERTIHKRLTEAGVKIGLGKETDEFVWLYGIHDELNYGVRNLEQTINYKGQLVSKPVYVEKTMCEVMNNVLPNGITIGASTHISNCWTK